MLSEVAFSVDKICSVSARYKVLFEEGRTHIFGIQIREKEKEKEYLNPVLVVNTSDGRQYTFYFKTDQELTENYHRYIHVDYRDPMIMFKGTTRWSNSYEN